MELRSLVCSNVHNVIQIADLEITNRSLLTINSQLEANKHKQAKEIRELRRKLRESRLILPPRTYRTLKEDGAEETGDDESEYDEGRQDDEEDELAEIDRLGKEDEHFSRVRTILDALLETEPKPRALLEHDLQIHRAIYSRVDNEHLRATLLRLDHLATHR